MDAFEMESTASRTSVVLLRSQEFRRDIKCVGQVVTVSNPEG